MFRGSTSSCLGKGQATKMQSIGCPSRMRHFESYFHLKVGFESQPFHFFDRFLAVEVGLDHYTRI